MAYFDYTGQAYRNGRLIAARSDATDTPVSGHSVLGDGPVYVALIKRSVSVYRGSIEVARYEPLDDTLTSGDFRLPLGHVVTIAFVSPEAPIACAKLTQPDGTFWHGWSCFGSDPYPGQDAIDLLWPGEVRHRACKRRAHREREMLNRLRAEARRQR